MEAVVTDKQQDFNFPTYSSSEETIMTAMSEWSELIDALTAYKKNIEKRVDLTMTAGSHDRRTIQQGQFEGTSRGTIIRIAKRWHQSAMAYEAASNTPEADGGKTEERLKTEPKKRETKKKKEEGDAKSKVAGKEAATA